MSRSDGFQLYGLWRLKGTFKDETLYPAWTRPSASRTGKTRPADAVAEDVKSLKGQLGRADQIRSPFRAS